MSIRGSKARVKLLGDDRVIDDIDISMINAKVDSFIEVFANIALGTVSSREARERKEAWLAVMNARR